jgi:hypothetical protein
VLPCLQPSFVVLLLPFVQSGLFRRCALAQPLLGNFVLVSRTKTRRGDSGVRNFSKSLSSVSRDNRLASLI